MLSTSLTGVTGHRQQVVQVSVVRVGVFWLGRLFVGS
jgi:hypothetical protein